ncbi:unnamed protein product [Schistosoma mattheei]|uniref:Uncharacterized protein n=1 Tax=Schistosoma mattheei TaxID=31246 RepID=A0A183NY88_9TREM|nr:unnamed protein product [Schistosoma mattheei]
MLLHELFHDHDPSFDVMDVIIETFSQYLFHRNKHDLHLPMLLTTFQPMLSIDELILHLVKMLLILSVNFVLPYCTEYD